MKKIFTLLFSAGIAATSFAQSGSHQNADKKSNQYVTNTEYKKIDTHRDNIYTFTSKERNIQIEKINRDFNLKAHSIKSNHRIDKRTQKRLIQKAKLEKTQQINAVNAKFNSKFNAAFNGHDANYRKH